MGFLHQELQSALLGAVMFLWVAQKLFFADEYLSLFLVFLLFYIGFQADVASHQREFFQEVRLCIVVGIVALGV